MGRKNTTSRQAYDYIRNKIETGAWETPTKINEQDISDYLKISRSPVRKAIQQLEAEGLLTIEAYRGAYVAQPKLRKRDFIERLQILELLVSQYLFQVEAKSYILDIESLKKELKNIKELNKSENFPVELLAQGIVFIEQLLAEQPNAFYKQTVLKIAREINYMDIPEIKKNMKEIREIIIRNFGEIILCCEKRDFPNARKTVRILANRLMLEIIDN